jgi:hypothetical protein
MAKNKRLWQEPFVTGTCWFVAMQLLVFGALKFSPVGFFSYPSYPEKFVAWGYPPWFSFVHWSIRDLCRRDADPSTSAFSGRGSPAVHPPWRDCHTHHQSRCA